MLFIFPYHQHVKVLGKQTRYILFIPDSSSSKISQGCLQTEISSGRLR